MDTNLSKIQKAKQSEITEQDQKEAARKFAEALEGPKWGTEKQKYPACSLDCECFDIGMAHEREYTRKYCEQLIIAIRLICDERGLKQNNKNLNELIGEVHGRWVKDLQREKGALR